MKHFYERGQKRVYKEMNIFHVVKRLNHIIELLKEQGLITRRSMWLINHSSKNVINCDDDEESELTCTSDDQVDGDIGTHQQKKEKKQAIDGQHSNRSPNIHVVGNQQSEFKGQVELSPTFKG